MDGYVEQPTAYVVMPKGLCHVVCGSLQPIEVLLRVDLQ